MSKISLFQEIAEVTKPESIQYKLYILNKQIENILEKEVNEDTGEISETAIMELQNLESNKIILVDSLVSFYKNLNYFAGIINEEKTKLAEKEKSVSNKAEKVKRIIQTFLQGETLETARNKVSYRKSESVEVNLEDLLILNEPDELVKNYPDMITRSYQYKVDKVKAKEYIKNNIPIPEQIQLVGKTNIVIK